MVWFTWRQPFSILSSDYQKRNYSHESVHPKDTLRLGRHTIFIAAYERERHLFFVSKPLKNETETAPNGAVTVQDALSINERMGATEKVAEELAKGVYHIRGWGIAHTIAIDALRGWIIVDTGDSTKTAANKCR